MMSEQNFPAGWDQQRVARLIAHYDAMGDDALVAEDEAAQEEDGQTVMIVPTDLVPTVRELIARKKTA
jgi:hypothetical protein